MLACYFFLAESLPGESWPCEEASPHLSIGLGLNLARTQRQAQITPQAQRQHPYRAAEGPWLGVSESP